MDKLVPQQNVVELIPQIKKDTVDVFNVHPKEQRLERICEQIVKVNFFTVVAQLLNVPTLSRSFSCCLCATGVDWEDLGEMGSLFPQGRINQ